MTRWVYLLWSIAAAIAVAGLFSISHEVAQLEEDLVHTQVRIQADREAIHVLEAEWSYLNQPALIAERARRHLNLGPLHHEQVADFSQLPAPGGGLDDGQEAMAELPDLSPLPLPGPKPVLRAPDAQSTQAAKAPAPVQILPRARLVSDGGSQ